MNTTRGPSQSSASSATHSWFGDRWQSITWQKPSYGGFRDSNIADITVYIVNAPGKDYWISQEGVRRPAQTKSLWNSPWAWHCSDSSHFQKSFCWRSQVSWNRQGLWERPSCCASIYWWRQEGYTHTITYYSTSQPANPSDRRPTLAKYEGLFTWHIASVHPVNVLDSRHLSYIRTPAEMNVPEGYLRVCRPYMVFLKLERTSSTRITSTIRPL